MIILILGTMSRYKYKIRAELSGKKTILRERVIELGHFGFDPSTRIRAALIQGCQEHFSDPKCPIGKWSNFNPPFWEFSRKAGHA
jgi:hypothetical protein